MWIYRCRQLPITRFELQLWTSSQSLCVVAIVLCGLNHRLREIYIGICATTLGAFVYGQLPDIGVNRPPFPGDILVVFICTTLAAAAAMFALHIHRSQRAQNTLILGFDTEISTADADDSD